MNYRPIARVIRAQRAVEGGGFVVRRPFPGPDLDQLDPFLLLDEMGPVTYAPGEAVGAPDHPHRGFETVTYVLDGSVEHRDSTGAHGVIAAGEVQWMTAGSGIVHSEMPTEGIRRAGGRVHGFQLWVNLRAKDKMTAPRYQGLTADELAVAPLDAGGLLRVIAGTVAGVTGPVETTSPVAYAHVSLAAGTELVTAVPDDHTALVYVFAGAAQTADGRPIAEGTLVAYEHQPGQVRVSAEVDTELLVLTGEPLREPIARYGPFVMNTRAEIEQAFDDYRAGRLGSIPAAGSGVSR